MGFKIIIAGYFVSFLLICAGLIAIFYGKNVIHKSILDKLKLTPETQIYQKWLKTPFDIYMTFYIYNLTNQDEFELGEKPILREIGPYVYKEVRVKDDVQHTENNTIIYKAKRQFYFVADKSVDLELPITTLNMASIVAMNTIKFKSLDDAERFVFNAAMQNTERDDKNTILITKKAKEILWGFENEFLEGISRFDPSKVSDTVTGLFHKKNNTVDGTFEIKNGVGDPKSIGEIISINNMTELPYWSSQYANQINGTDASVNPQFMNKLSTPYSYQLDLCRSFQSTFVETYKAHNLIDLLGFGLTAQTFANPSVNPDNAGFCTPALNCPPSGLLNLTNCLKNGASHVPILISPPHFLFGDPSLLENVSGLKPIHKDHRTIVFYEPVTGAPMKAQKRLQFNTKLFKHPDIEASTNIPEIYYPIFWLDESFEIDAISAKAFYNKITKILLYFDILKFALLGAGIVLAVLCIIFSVIVKRREVKFHQVPTTEQKH